jgi:hypothetical protein
MLDRDPIDGLMGDDAFARERLVCPRGQLDAEISRRTSRAGRSPMWVGLDLERRLAEAVRAATNRASSSLGNKYAGLTPNNPGSPHERIYLMLVGR